MNQKDIRRLREGDVVYYAEFDPGLNKYRALPGVFSYEHLGWLNIEIIDIPCFRMINGVSVDRFESEKEWRKLPRGWTYNTKLFEDEWCPPKKWTEWAEKADMTDPKLIRRALDVGKLVLKRNRFLGNIEAEISNGMYRIVKKAPWWSSSHVSVSLLPMDVFFDYESAKARAEEIKGERERLNRMSDEDWSRLEIEKMLMRVPESKRQKYREKLFSLPDLWDVEVKSLGDDLVWRYFTKRSAWAPIVTDECG